ILFERLQPEPRLVICGAGHVGAALARLASLTGYKATLIDDRADFVVRDRFPDDRIELIAAENWNDAVRQAIGNGRGVSVAVVTRGHNEDEECLRAVITTDADYVGLIGSKRRTNIVLQRLREVGAELEKLRKVHAPVGLDIGAVTPEEVALAILAEMVAERRGGTGGSLSSWRRVSKT
ncbi:MAG TPA: XdhC family protein, partial [Pyrinomonadaceae bacterium]|nr:XdhC family protein [Pyrinomonadaceae bacterium]